MCVCVWVVRGCLQWTGGLGRCAGGGAGGQRGCVCVCGWGGGRTGRCGCVGRGCGPGGRAVVCFGRWGRRGGGISRGEVGEGEGRAGEGRGGGPTGSVAQDMCPCTPPPAHLTNGTLVMRLPSPLSGGRRGLASPLTAAPAAACQTPGLQRDAHGTHTRTRGWRGWVGLAAVWVGASGSHVRQQHARPAAGGTSWLRHITCILMKW